MGIVPISPEIGMAGQQNAQQAASRVGIRIPQTGSDFPVNKFSLPSATANQNHRYRYGSNEILADSLKYRFRRGMIANLVFDVHRFINNMVSHHTDKLVFVRLVLVVMVTDENVMTFR